MQAGPRSGISGMMVREKLTPISDYNIRHLLLSRLRFRYCQKWHPDAAGTPIFKNSGVAVADSMLRIPRDGDQAVDPSRSQKSFTVWHALADAIPC